MFQPRAWLERRFIPQAPPDISKSSVRWRLQQNNELTLRRRGCRRSPRLRVGCGRTRAVGQLYSAFASRGPTCRRVCHLEAHEFGVIDFLR